MKVRTKLKREYYVHCHINNCGKEIKGATPTKVLSDLDQHIHYAHSPSSEAKTTKEEGRDETSSVLP